MADQITPQERELLEAIVSLLAIPHCADYHGRQGYYDTLAIRAARLRGVLEATLAAGAGLGTAAKVCRSVADDEPLRYTPEPSTEGSGDNG